MAQRLSCGFIIQTSRVQAWSGFDILFSFLSSYLLFSCQFGPLTALDVHFVMSKVMKLGKKDIFINVPGEQFDSFVEFQHNIEQTFQQCFWPGAIQLKYRKLC